MFRKLHILYTIFAKVLIICKQMTGNLVNERNYAKETQGLFTRIIGKISARTICNILISKIKNRLAKLNMR